jgi:dipeptidyl aminopeptidase/acylaminoacyl peptidase
MTNPTIAPYGSWHSPITADLLLGGTVNLSQPLIDGEFVYWLEGRPLEGGRNVVVRRSEAGGEEDVTPPDFNVRTRVHEYGGGDYMVGDGVVYFANYVDQRIYQQRPGATPQAITPEAALRYADFMLDTARGRLICIREDHRQTDREALNSLVAVPLDGGEQVVIAEGNDFYASPRLSHDGRRLAWLAWKHPNMPWDGTELWLADVAADGSLINRQLVAGGPSESIFQPEWSPDGKLYFISDRTGWWNLYRLRGRDVSPESLYQMDAEFGLPQWVFGMSTYAFNGPDEIICTYTRDGARSLARLDAATGGLHNINTDWQGTYLRAGGGRVVYIGASPTQPPAVVRLDPATGAFEVLRRSTAVEVDDGYVSVAQAVEFPTEGGLTAHGYFYRPRNRDYAAPVGELPPLIVMSHGGPTSSRNGDLNLAYQYWTSRGFALLDVNYGGSTGYGRAYRERLNGNWGVVDVDDCINGAHYLVEQRLVDGERLIIRGGSAGGYTTLCAITFRDVFKAAASHFGVSDAEALARDTHKFESRYTDNLLGPYPERRDLYTARSPIHAAQNCSAALILFQGLEDKVVPPDQSEAMFIAARNRELPVAYLVFEGEGHGFRQASNIKRAIEAELYFYGRVFGFDLAEVVEPVEIENL